MVLEDYIVEYEGFCEPEVSSCFVGCEDDECTTEYYYTIVTKNAPQLLEQCGADITDCDFAHICLPKGDEGCSITYCDTLVDGEDACVTVETEEVFEDSTLIQTDDNPMEEKTVTELII